MKFSKKETMVFVVIIIMALASKIIQYNFLPEKYFLDSAGILNMVNEGFDEDGTGFAFTARTFGFINVLGLNTLLEWSITLTIIFNIIIFIFMRKFIATSSKSELIYFIASIFLVNIYVFNISKEAIQFTIFIIIYCICKSKKIGNLGKVILISIMFFIESLYFRTYYILMSVFMMVIYFLLNNSIKERRLRPLVIIMKILVVFFIILSLAKFVLYEEYNAVMTVRYNINKNRTTSINAQTVILDLIQNSSGNLSIFMINYILNSIRMLIPLELLFKGIKYFPFIIYQIYIVINLSKGLKKLNKNNIIFITCIISYLLGSFIFEPDFGSLIRHESTTFFIMAHLIRLNRGNNEENITEKNYLYRKENIDYDKSVA